MKVIIYTRASDGGTTIEGPVEGARLVISVTLADGTVLLPEIEGAIQCADQFLRRWPVEGAVADWAETEDEFIARIMPKCVPADATNVQIVDRADIPADRTFRNALKPDLTHDMVEARDIYRDILRAERAPLLTALDIDYQRADEVGDAAAKQAIAVKKQALRDITDDPAIAAAKTTDALKAVRPAALDEPAKPSPQLREPT